MGGGKIAYVSCDWRSFQQIAPAACYRGRGRSLIPAGTVSASKLTVLIPAHLSRTDGRGPRRCCCFDEGQFVAGCRVGEAGGVRRRRCRAKRHRAADAASATSCAVPLEVGGAICVLEMHASLLAGFWWMFRRRATASSTRRRRRRTTTRSQLIHSPLLLALGV